MQRVPSIARQRYGYLDLRVPSRGTPGLLRQIQFWKDGNFNCGCPGYYWGVKSEAQSRQCRHWRETTMVTGDMPITRLKRAIRALKQGARSNVGIWQMLKCLYPYKYKLGVRCVQCPLYPHWCNVHPIKFSKRGTKKPVIWKIQTALYAGRKKAALKMMNKLLIVAEALHPGGETHE